MTDTISQIKAEIERIMFMKRINELSRMAEFDIIEIESSDIPDFIKITKALSVAVEALDHYNNHPSVIKEAYHSNEEKQITVIHTFINHKAKEAIKTIAEILKDGLK